MPDDRGVPFPLHCQHPGPAKAVSFHVQGVVLPNFYDARRRAVRSARKSPGDESQKIVAQSPAGLLAETGGLCGLVLVQERHVFHGGCLGFGVHQNAVPAVQRDGAVVRVTDRPAAIDGHIALHDAPVLLHLSWLLLEQLPVLRYS